MKLTPEQQRVVEQNLGLVGKVIKDKVHGLGQTGVLLYEDLFQIGCIGLCKAAATDKGGCFSTYAYRIIWNEICDALIQASRINGREMELEFAFSNPAAGGYSEDLLESCELRAILEQIRDNAKGILAKGIQCLLLTEEGYSSKELGQLFSSEPAAVRMWMTKARRYLSKHPDLITYVKGEDS